MNRRIIDSFLKHRRYDLALLVLISLVAASRWFNFELPTGHDTLGEMLLAQIARESVFNHGMPSGWITSWYIGLPLFHVHPPLLPFLITALSFPFGWVLGTKVLYLSFYVLSGVFAYLYVHQITRSRPASFVAGLAYVFAPYHVLDMGFEGHQGAFGMPYMLTPLILLCLERLLKKPTASLVLVTAILLASLALSYPQVFPFLVGPFLVLYVVFRAAVDWKRGQQVARPLFASLITFCLALLLTAFWWLPLISDIHNFQQTQFPLEAAKQFSATFSQAITLRPETCCAPASAYGASGSALVETLRILPLLLVLLGIILTIRNKYVWFFSASIVMTWLLAMGPYSPVNIFGFAHNYIPFFSGIRTPVRFLLFTSLAYAILIGFCAKGITEWLKHIHLRRPGFLNLSSLALLTISLVIVGNTWQETRTAFTTFTLSTDQENAFAWLKQQDDGEYRIAGPPFDTWVYDPEAGNIINPTYWTYLHGKETVGGGVPAMAVKYTGNTLQSLDYSLKTAAFDMSAWLNIFNVKYLLVDKTNPLSSSIIIGENLECVWPSETIDIYENHSILPRIFSITPSNERQISLWNDDNASVSWAEGSTDVEISLDSDHASSQEFAVKAVYRFKQPKGEWVNLGMDVSGTQFNGDDAIQLVFYSDVNLPSLHLAIDLFEQDGSRYGMDLNRADGIQAGWNEISLPISLLPLRYSSDENHRLDPDQIAKLWFGVGEQSNKDRSQEFQLYLNALSVISQPIDTDAQHTKIAPGKYQVHVNLASPTCLVLSESYHPDWTARINGHEIPSQITYECLNGFYLEPGEYDITLEFVTSPLRKAGGLVSSITFLVICCIPVFLLIRVRWKKTPGHPNAAGPRDSDA